jgi:hypothetical protein
MCALQRDYLNLSFKSNLIGTLNDIIAEAEEWQKNALKVINGQASEAEKTALLQEGRTLRCRLPFVLESHKF